MEELRTLKNLSNFHSSSEYLSFLHKKRMEFLVTLPDTILKLAVKANIDINLNPKNIEISSNFNLGESVAVPWRDPLFHLKYRIHLNHVSTEADFKKFFELVPVSIKRMRFLKKIIKEGVLINGKERAYYDLSILPLNYLLGEPVINYFLPPEDYLQPHPAKQPDPYGLIKGKTRVKGFRDSYPTIVDNEGNVLLGTHKFTHTFLYNIDFYCPIGCSDCYKTRLGTREHVEGERKVFLHESYGKLVPPTRAMLKHMTEKLVKWMNEDPRGRLVYDVIISGGEPLFISNDHFKVLLDEFSKAKNLKILRICTASIFLGYPFRIDDEFVSMLKDFSESTGVRVTIQVHLGNHHMITPEAVYAVYKFRQVGIPLYSQIPIKNGINFFLDDINKTINYLVELGKKQVVIGVEPYMFIVDMHPSTNAYYVPIEPLMQVWGTLVESHDYPGLERPKTLSVLFKGGNIILSGHALFSAYKVVKKEEQKVVYYIPRVGPGMNWEGVIEEMFIYEEPLISGVNDDPRSLEKIREKFKNVMKKQLNTKHI